MAITIAMALLISASPTHAQGTFTTLQTGSGNVLVTETAPLTIPAGASQVDLAFQFGFSTDEAVVPDAFVDALTVSLLSGDGADYLPLVTVDTSGALWVPSGGTVSFSDNEVMRTAIGYPSGPPALAHSSAWQTSLQLPSTFSTGMPVSLYFDLFDNGDAVMSAGWFANVTIQAVPEPASVSFWLLGLAGVVWWKRRGGL